MSIVTTSATAKVAKTNTSLSREQVVGDLKKSRTKYLNGKYLTEKQEWALEGGLRELVGYK